MVMFDFVNVTTLMFNHFEFITYVNKASNIEIMGKIYENIINFNALNKFQTITVNSIDQIPIISESGIYLIKF